MELHCPKCEQEKDETLFSKSSSRSTGRQYCCKDCERSHRELNKEKLSCKRKEYYKKNKDRLNEYCRKWHKENKEHLRGYYQSKRKVRNQQRRDLLQNNPSFKLASNLRRRIIHALKGDVKSEDTLSLIGCTYQELKSHLESKFKDGMGWDNWTRDGWHVDHIIPCSAFDLTDPAQQKKCFHYTNLQPLWAFDNLTKNTKII